MDAIKAFEMLDMRVGRIVRCEPNEKARKPSYKLWVDFTPPPEVGPDALSEGAGENHESRAPSGGSLGIKQSSAQLSDLYQPEDLPGKLVIAAVNLGSRRIAGFKSEILVMGVPDEDGRVVLLQPERDIPLGGRVF